VALADTSNICGEFDDVLGQKRETKDPQEMVENLNA
jgi:hypothetical protein